MLILASSLKQAQEPKSGFKFEVYVSGMANDDQKYIQIFIIWIDWLFAFKT